MKLVPNSSKILGKGLTIAVKGMNDKLLQLYLEKRLHNELL